MSRGFWTYRRLRTVRRMVAADGGWVVDELRRRSSSRSVMRDGEAADAVCCDFLSTRCPDCDLCRTAEIVGTGDEHVHHADEGGDQGCGRQRPRPRGNGKMSETPEGERRKIGGKQVRLEDEEEEKEKSRCSRRWKDDGSQCLPVIWRQSRTDLLPGIPWVSSSNHDVATGRRRLTAEAGMIRPRQRQPLRQQNSRP